MSVEWNPLSSKSNVTLSNDNEGRDYGGRAMIHKEQLAAIRAKVLVVRLRRRDPFPSWEYMYDDAADEIERLEAEVKRLNDLVDAGIPKTPGPSGTGN